MKRSLSGTYRLLMSDLQRLRANLRTSLKQMPFSPPRNSQQAMVFSKLRAAQQYLLPMAMAEDWLLSREVKQRSWQGESFFQRLRSNSTSSFLELDTRILEFLRQTASTTLIELLAFRLKTPQNSDAYCYSSCLLLFAPTALSSSFPFFFFLAYFAAFVYPTFAYPPSFFRLTTFTAASSLFLLSSTLGTGGGTLLRDRTSRTISRRIAATAIIISIIDLKYYSLTYNSQQLMDFCPFLSIQNFRIMDLNPQNIVSMNLQYRSIIKRTSIKFTQILACKSNYKFTRPLQQGFACQGHQIMINQASFFDNFTILLFFIHKYSLLPISHSKEYFQSFASKFTICKNPSLMIKAYSFSIWVNEKYGFLPNQQCNSFRTYCGHK